MYNAQRASRTLHFDAQGAVAVNVVHSEEQKRGTDRGQREHVVTLYFSGVLVFFTICVYYLYS